MGLLNINGLLGKNGSDTKLQSNENYSILIPLSLFQL